MDKIHLFISNSEIRDARLLFVRILLFIPLLVMVMAVNMSIDPAGLYRKKVHPHENLEYHIAQALSAGTNIRIEQQDIDERLVEKYLVEKISSAPDVVILGSSHSMHWENNIFPDNKVINNSVIEAGLADYLGIFDGYTKRNLYPKRIICVLDPQLIGSPLISEKWLSIKDDTYDMLCRLGIHTEKFKQPLIQQKWFNIFSFSYFQQSINRFWGRHKTTEKSREELVWEFFHEKNGRLLNHMKTDKELEDILENFIRHLLEHHVQVTLYLSPVQPMVYKTFLDMQEKQASIDIVAIEHYYRDLAQRSKLEISGSYDPAVCGLEDKDFYDGDHVKDDVLDKMLKQKGSKCSMP